MNRLILVCVLAVFIFSPGSTQTTTMMVSKNVTAMNNFTVTAATEAAEQTETPGTEPTLVAGEPTQAAGETTQVAGETTQAAGETTQAAGETQAVGETTQAGGEPTQAGGEPTQAGGEPTQAGGEPTQAGDSPIVKLTLSVLAITNPDDAVFGLATGQNVNMDISVVLQSDSDSVSGDINWKVLIALTNDSTTTLFDSSNMQVFADTEAVLEPESAYGVDLGAGDTYTFSAVATLALTNITECVYSHLCVGVGPGDESSWRPDMDNSVLVRCEQVYCSAGSLKLHLVLVTVVILVHALHKGVF